MGVRKVYAYVGIVTVSLISLFTGCERATSPSTSFSLPYIPLAIGHWWGFDPRQIDSTGNVVAPGYRYFDSTVAVARTIVSG